MKIHANVGHLCACPAAKHYARRNRVTIGCDNYRSEVSMTQKQIP